jgi:hypothetical protein
MNGVMSDAELASGPQMLTRSASFLTPDPDVLHQLLYIPQKASQREKERKRMASGGRKKRRPSSGGKQLKLRPRTGEVEFHDDDDVDDDDTQALTPASAINSAVLRQHFHRLTTQLLALFDRYFTMRPKSKVHPYSDVNDCFERFHEAAFIASLIRTGERGAPAPVLFRQCGMQSSAQWARLVKRFIRSPNFKPWYLRRRRNALREFQVLKDTLCISMPPSDFVAELEMSTPLRFELCLQIQKLLRSKLAQARAQSPPPGEAFLMCERLVMAMRGHFLVLHATLPEEVRQSIDLGLTDLPIWLEEEMRRIGST